MYIVGPGKKKAKDIVKNIFQNARKHGAVEAEAARSSMNYSESRFACSPVILCTSV